MSKKLNTTQVQEIVEGMASRLSYYIEECSELPSKFECYECGRASNEYFVCGCHHPNVCEYKQCPECGDDVDVDDESVWHCCMTVKVVDESEIEDYEKKKFSELLNKLYKKAQHSKPKNKNLDEWMIKIVCDAYEDDVCLKEATDFVNGLTN